MRTTTAASVATSAVNQTADLAGAVVERARLTSRSVRDQAARAGQRAVGYVQDEPVKAVLTAMAAGALIAALTAWTLRSRS